jgi:hypothetical protein
MQEKSKNSSDKKEKILTLIKKHKYRMQIHIKTLLCIVADQSI